MNKHTGPEPMDPEALEAALRAIGPERYHDLHPFHGLLHDGKLKKGQVQAWALNRYVYQAAIPMKDASLIGRCEDRALRREWLHRVADHDGAGDRTEERNRGKGRLGVHRQSPLIGAELGAPAAPRQEPKRSAARLAHLSGR
jgi:hypothetical protein